MKDTKGREYAKLSELKPGDKVQVDGGFDCMKPEAVKTVWFQDGDYYLRCKAGRHSLEGQLADDGDSLIGIYRSEQSPNA